MRVHSSHLFVSRWIYEADRGPRLAALPENRPRRNQVAPVCVFATYCSRMLGIREIAEDELEELVSVALEAQPREQATACRLRRLAQPGGRHGLAARGARRRDGRRRLRARRLAHAAAPRDRSGVRPARRARRGRRHRASSTRSRAGRPSTACTELEGPVSRGRRAAASPGRRATATTRCGRNSRLVLDLTSAEIAEPAPPEGIEIVTWADRPELAQGLWEVAREATS